MFWKKKTSSERRSALTPHNTRIYAIGDIHGQADLLIGIHKMILDDSIDCSVQNKIIVYLGDYIDRGFQSKDVTQQLVDNNLDSFKKVYLKGNHEDAMLTFLDKPTFGDTWLLWGGEATLRSYGIAIHNKNNQRIDMYQLSKNLKEALPSEHKDFFNNLKISHTEGDYLFVHAGLKPGVSIDKQKDSDMLTIREEFIFSQEHFDKTIVFGHTIFMEPLHKNGRIGVDTGAYIYGKLTCVVLEGESVRFLTATRNK